MAGAFAVSGVVHLVRPQVFEPLVPRWLPARRALVVGSGVAELGCAVGLATRQPWAPVASAALLAAVWPGNLQHALAVQRSSRSSTAMKVAVWARLPLQIPMIRWALAAGNADPKSGSN